MIKSKLRVQEGSLLPYLAALIALASAAMVFMNFSITKGSYYFDVNKDIYTNFTLENIGWLVMAGGLVLLGLFLLFAAKKKLGLMVIPVLVFTAGIGVNAFQNIVKYAYLLVLVLLFAYFFIITALNVIHNKYISCVFGLLCFIGVAVLVYLQMEPLTFTGTNGTVNYDFSKIIPNAGYYLSLLLLVLSLTNDYNLDTAKKSGEGEKSGKKKGAKTPEELADEIMKRSEKEGKKSKKKDNGSNANWALLGKAENPEIVEGVESEPVAVPNSGAAAAGESAEPEKPVQDAASIEEEKRLQKEREARELLAARQKIEENRRRMMASYVPDTSLDIAKKEEEERLAREKAEAERIAREKAEAEKIAAEAEAARLAAEAETARVAAEQAAAAEKAEAERMAAFAKAEAERVAAQNAQAAQSETKAESANAEPVLTVPVSGTKLQKTLKEDIVYDQKLMYKRKINVFAIIGLILSVCCILIGAIMITKIVDVAALKNDNLGIPMVAIGLFMICVFGTRLTYKEYYTKAFERKVVREETNWDEVLASRLEEDETSIQILTANYAKMSEMYGRLLESNAELAKGIAAINNSQIAGPVAGQTVEASIPQPVVTAPVMEEAAEETSEVYEETVVEEDEFRASDESAEGPQIDPEIYVEDNNPLNDDVLVMAGEAPTITLPDYEEEAEEVETASEEIAAVEEAVAEEIAAVEEADPYSLDSIIAEEPKDDYFTAYAENEAEASSILEENVEAILEETVSSSVSENAAFDEDVSENVDNIIEAVEEEPVEDAIEAVEETVEDAIEAVEEETVEDAIEAVEEETVEEAIEAVEEETVEEAIEAVEEPVEDAIEAVEETVEDAIEAVAEETVDDTIETVEDVIEETAEDTAMNTIEETVEEAIEETAEETVEETASDFGSFGFAFFNGQNNEEPAFTTESVSEPVKEEPKAEANEFGNNEYTGYNDDLISSMFSRYQKRTPVVETPVEETIEETVEEAIEETPIEETIEETVAEVIEETPIEETIEEVIEETPIEETIEDVIEESPLEETIEDVIEEAPIEETIEGVLEETPLEETIEDVIEETPIEETPYAEMHGRRVDTPSEEADDINLEKPSESINERSWWNNQYAKREHKWWDDEPEETPAATQTPVTENAQEEDEEETSFTLPTFRGFSSDEPEEEKEDSIFGNYGYNREPEEQSDNLSSSFTNRFEDTANEEEEDNGIIEGFVLPTFRGFSSSIEDEDEQPVVKETKPLSQEPRVASSGINFFSAPNYGSQDDDDEDDDEPILPTFTEEIPESTYDMPEDEDEPEDEPGEAEEPEEPTTANAAESELSPEEERRRKLQEKLAQIYNRNRERQQQEAARDDFSDLMNFDDSPVIYFNDKKK